MKKNMGTLDRIIRILAAIVISYLYITGSLTGTLGMALVGLAVIFLVTGFISFCPLYTLFGIKTCSNK
jgi:hypothetical protein